MERETAIAVIGMAGRFAGARNVDAFWANLRNGVHSIAFACDRELEAAGMKPRIIRDPAYVNAHGVVQDADRFDASFFGFSPREAEVLDPQHRMFLETAWEALENAGYDPGSMVQAVGIYAGSSRSQYLTRHVLPRTDIIDAIGSFQVEIANAPDFLVTRTAHKLNLRGPALNVQTACSTALVAVHVACQALAAGECDVALAGGVSIRPGRERGYLYTPGGIMSPDGYCRAFDVRAEGTVGGDGVGLVVLKRLADALSDGDTVHAVVRGSAINNDGASKVGFVAPSVDGQVAVIEEALAIAGVAAETVGYVEAHGTGTKLGDLVEVAALTQAFGAAARKQSCVLGSVKTNIGHLDAAAGVAGLIKAVLAVKHGEIPPTLHYTAPNPEHDLSNTPFCINTELRRWPGDEQTPRRAGVSSFGIGGTNAHVVLEQAPEQEPSVIARPWQLLTLSARTPAALEAATDRLAAHLRKHREQALADTAWTLQMGRRGFRHRRALVARDAEDAAAALEARSGDRLIDGEAPDDSLSVAFLFPGTGSFAPGSGVGLYESEPTFREAVDRCADILRADLRLDLHGTLYPDVAQPDACLDRLTPTVADQVGIFVTEYALAQLWMTCGVRPKAMVGHSLGEYVAATLAGVWSLEDALMLVAERARLIEEQPAGGMVSVGLGETDLRALLRDGLCVAARNGPAMTVVAGPVAALDALMAELSARDIPNRRLGVGHAFHSTLMEPAAQALAARVRGVRMCSPRIPFASTVTGCWIRDSEATDPDYWARHLHDTVRFSEAMETLAGTAPSVMLEVGPSSLWRLARQLRCWGEVGPIALASLPRGHDIGPESVHLLEVAGRLWAAGVPVDWEAMHAGEMLRRVPIPTYPFERQRYWVESGTSAKPSANAAFARKPDPEDCLYVPAWTRTPVPVPAAPPTPGVWLVLADEAEIGVGLAAKLRAQGHVVIVVRAGVGFEHVGGHNYTVCPGSAADLTELREALHAAGIRPRHVVQLWGVVETTDSFEQGHARGYGTVAALAAAFAQTPVEESLRLIVVTDSAQDVAGDEPVRPERATVIGACLALPYEHAHVTCRIVDVRLRAGSAERLVDQLLAELSTDGGETMVALRGPHRWVRSYQALRPARNVTGMRPGGGYLFSGPPLPGNVELVEHLAGRLGTRIAIVVDPGFPERESWDVCLRSLPPHDDVALTIRAIRAAEARGCAPLVLYAAPRDGEALRAAVAVADDAFGGLHGVIHGSGRGAAVKTSPLAEVKDADVEADLGAVLRELAALREATSSLALDFCILQNSTLAVSGERGRAAATAVSVLVDAWAQCQAGGGGRWTSVCWDAWQPEAEERGAALRGSGGWSISREEILRAWEHVARLCAEPRIVISTRDPGLRTEQDRARDAAPAPCADADCERQHSRPELASEQQGATSAAEQILVEMWRDLFGVADVGIHDDFFEFGGHSLIAMQLLARVRSTFQVSLPPRAIFDAPTIAELAELIDDTILDELTEIDEEQAVGLLQA